MAPDEAHRGTTRDRAHARPRSGASAFDGSEWGASRGEFRERNAPAAVSKTNVPSAAAGDAGAERSKSADLVDSSKAARSSEAPFASARSASTPFACRLDSNALLANPKAKRKLDTVSRLSEAPCRTSTLARTSPYRASRRCPRGWSRRRTRGGRRRRIRRPRGLRLGAGEEPEVREVGREARLEELGLDPRGDPDRRRAEGDAAAGHAPRVHVRARERAHLAGGGGPAAVREGEERRARRSRRRRHRERGGDDVADDERGGGGVRGERRERTASGRRTPGRADDDARGGGADERAPAPGGRARASSRPARSLGVPTAREATEEMVVPIKRRTGLTST